VWKRETETEKRQTAGAAAGGRVTTKGSVRQSSENDRSRDTENRGEDGARGRLLFFITFICFIIPEPNTKQDPACIARDRACDCCKCVLVIISSFFLSLSEPISGICANQHCTADEGRERKTVMQRERERERGSTPVSIIDCNCPSMFIVCVGCMHSFLYVLHMVVQQCK